MLSEPLTCPDVADALTTVADGGVLAERAGAHVAECLRCQAEVAQYHRLARTLRELVHVGPVVPPALEHEILLSLDRDDDRYFRRVPGRAAAALGGIAAAAGVIALASRGLSRQRRLARQVV